MHRPKHLKILVLILMVQLTPLLTRCATRLTDLDETSAAPQANGTPESPATATANPTATLDRNSASPEGIEKGQTSPEKAKGVRITIVYDNTAYDPDLIAEWGFSALIEYGEKTLLFDTGGDGTTLLGNMAKLGIDPQTIQVVVLSHIHMDHTGGLQELLDTGVRPTVYAPAAFPDDFKESVRAQTDLIEVTETLEILPGIHSTGELYSNIAEQALVIETEAGIVVMSGCAHPGIVRMVQRAQEIVAAEVALVVGGFHLKGRSQGVIRDIIADFRQVGVQQVSPTHCTGDQAIEIFADEYGDDYVQGGVGRVIIVGPQ